MQFLGFCNGEAGSFLDDRIVSLSSLAERFDFPDAGRPLNLSERYLAPIWRHGNARKDTSLGIRIRQKQVRVFSLV
jgi:hypothetical protein